MSMAIDSSPTTDTPKTQDAHRASWLPMAIIVMAQIQMSFNVNALPVSVGPIVEDLKTPATSVATALVVYSLVVAATVMVGAKLGRMVGARLMFQVSVIVHAVGMGMMTFSTDTRTMNNAQAIAGIAAAALVPTLVVLIAMNYQDRQLAQALGLLAGAGPVAGALAFFIAGFLGSTFGWRYSFGILIFLAAAVLILSFKFKPVPRQPGIKIDMTGAVLAAAAIAMISFGFNNLNAWGLVLAKPSAPFSLLGLSPAPFMIVLGLVVGQAFFAWSQRRVAEHKMPLLALEVLDTREERATLYAFFIIGALGPAINFLIPLYIQIIQDRSTMFTAVAVVPYTISIATSAILVVRLYDFLTIRSIGVIAFILVGAALSLLAFTVHNDWGTPTVILGLIVAG